MIEAPEFHTKPSSPLSPLPLHPSEPSRIPVLQNQIDQTFNMTSTHTEISQDAPTTPEDIGPDLLAAVSAGIEDEDSPSDKSSFSDAYKDQPVITAGNAVEVVIQEEDGDEESDYAMTFDSDAEEAPDSHVISTENVEEDSNSLPTTVPVQSSNALLLVTPEPLTADTNIAHINSLSTHPPTDEHPSDTPTQNQNETISATQPHEELAKGEIDIQALLDNITANAEKNDAASALSSPTSANPSSSSLSKGLSNLPAHSSLPPRPQVPLPNYSFNDDAANNRTGPTNYPKPTTAYRPPPGVNAPLIPSGAAPGTSTDTRGVLFAPPVASFRQNVSYPAGSPTNPGASFQNAPGVAPQEYPSQSIERSGEDHLDSDTRWGQDVQKKYDVFLTEERNYVTDGQWDKFPNGSRLFIGNLPSEKVTKRDIFHVFHKYGRLAQIAIKSAYGFVQFHDSSACRAALVNEEGSEIRGRKIHLEVSKAQKNTNNRNTQASNNNGPVRRSRSPDYGRGHTSERGGRGGHIRQGSRAEVRDEYGRVLRNGRDDYRPGRSPTPPRDNYRSRDGYAPPRGDQYDGRERWRSRSRSPPYGQRFSGGYRERSPSPRRREAVADAELELPRRESHNVPDLQLILTAQLDRNFVSWVEGEFHARGLKFEVLYLNPRLPLADVIHRQIIEGVHAVSLLDVRSQNSSTIPLQVFDRQAGANNVRFDEYQDLEPRIAAELVLRTKSQAATTYPRAQPQYAPPQQSYQQPPVAAQVQDALPALANIVGQMDNASLQKLLGSMATSQQQNGAAAATNSGIDLASLLSGLKPQQQQSQYQAPIPNSYGGQDFASLANQANQAMQPAPQQSAQQVQNIMAQLARFRQ